LGKRKYEKERKMEKERKKKKGKKRGKANKHRPHPYMHTQLKKAKKNGKWKMGK